MPDFNHHVLTASRIRTFYLQPQWKTLLRPNIRRSSSVSSSPKVSTSGTKPQKWTRRLLYTATGLGTIWFVDRQFNASSLTRNVRTLTTCLAIALDYKLNFRPEKSDKIPALHERVAERIYDCLTKNGGLYIKIGQAIANNAAIMPRPIQEKFAKLFDDAPQVPYDVVRRVFELEFNMPPSGPDGVFEIFEEKAMASASVAQVHRAKLKSDDGNGAWVAVKVQKPDVTRQVEWDLGTFRIVMWMYENWFFDMPVYFVVDFISDHLRRELDFEQEARNAMITAEFIAKEPRLSDIVYIPKVYPEYTTKKVLTAEWIDGVRLSDRRGIMRIMGEGEDVDMDLSPTTSRTPPAPALPGPLKGGVSWVIHTMVELFSAQIFEWGWVHCDPHPGNVIIRPHPSRPGRPQFVLIDHGLYVRLPDDFRRQYAQLWKGLMTVDFGLIQNIALQWGIGTPDLFASAVLLRPVSFSSRDDPEAAKFAAEMDKLDQYQKGVMMKQRLKNFLTDTDKMPKELIFIGRNMRIVQGNNQMFGSPVNRIRITGYWASRSLAREPTLSFSGRLREYVGYLKFLVMTLTIDTAFWFTKLKAWVRLKLGLKSEGFEDVLERSMKDFAKGHFGLEIADNAFAG